MSFLRLENLRKTFKETVAVKDVSLTIEEGELFGLLGPNGAGKSTTISMISTLIKPTGGDILLKGDSIIRNPNRIKSILGVVPQDIALYPTLTGYENLSVWGRLYGIKGKELEDRIEAIDKVIGLGSNLKKQVKTYSGGMKRRVNIGAALLHKPKILILDEPTVGIDPQSRKHILDMVLELNRQGITVIYTSHYMEEVESLCSRIAIMDLGTIIALGTKEELKNSILQGENFIVRVMDKELSLAYKYSALPWVEKVIQKEKDLIITAEKGQGSIKKIIEVLNGFEQKVEGITLENPSLEQVFFELTGKGLRD